jgi:hypothetical protein
MLIAGFGDSFIVPAISTPWLPNVDFTYTEILQKHYAADCHWNGYAGSGSWDAFFQALKYKEQPDVIIFAWSNSHRLYHPEVRNICGTAASQNRNSDDPIWQAVNMYYQHLDHYHKMHYEYVAFNYWVDNWVYDNFPNSKIIHMWSFPKVENERIVYGWDEPEKFNYYHRFKHGVEIRPALINLSYADGWPGDLSKEDRIHHLTPAMHRVLADHLIDAIENYEDGRLINIS